MRCLGVRARAFHHPSLDPCGTRATSVAPELLTGAECGARSRASQGAQEKRQEHLRRRVAGSGRHDPDARDLPEVAVECGDEARGALVRYRDDGGIGETQASLALAAEGFHDVGEHVRGRYELDVAGLKQDRSDPHGDIEPPTGEKHGDHLEKDVFGKKGRAPFTSDQLLHGAAAAP